MTMEFFVSVMPAEARGALFQDGQLQDVIIERTGRGSLVGNIYLGRVERVSTNIDAAFVDVGLSRSGFLPLDEGGLARRDESDTRTRNVHEGESVLVQITKDATGSKGVQLTRRVTLPGRLLVYSPMQDRVSISRKIDREEDRERLTAIMNDVARTGEGFILRTASAEASDADLHAEAERLRSGWVALEQARSAAKPGVCLQGDIDPVVRVLRDQKIDQLDQIYVDQRSAVGTIRNHCEAVVAGAEETVKFYASPHDMFDHLGINAEIEQALQKRVALPSGGEIVIESTEALTAIDVNSGRFNRETDSEQTAFRVNCEAASEAARQIRLRNLAGLVVVDFIRMENEADRQHVVDVLRGAVADDPAGVRIHGITDAGVMEITRRRQRESLSQIMTSACDTCSGAGVTLSAESVCLDILRAVLSDARVCPPGQLAVHVSPDIALMLEGRFGDALENVRELTGRAIEVRSQEEYAREQFDVQTRGRNG